MTINGCETGGDGGIFFANGGSSGGSFHTGNITVENCTMDRTTSGYAILVQTPPMEAHARGPFTFLNDTLHCGASVYVSCVQSSHANITVSNSTLIFPHEGATIHEPVYSAANGSGLNFAGDSVTGYGEPGWKDGTSTVNISGGAWAPYLPPQQSPGPVHPGPGSPVSSATSGSTGASTTTSTPPTTTAGALSLPGKGESGKGSAADGPGTATVLASDRNDPLGTPVARSIIALDLGAGAVAYGLILVRRRRHLGVVPAVHSVQDLLGRQRRSGSA